MRSITFLSLLLSLLFVGCNSVTTHNFEISRTVERSAIAEADNPVELKNKSLVFVVTSEKKGRISLDLRKNGLPDIRYCKAELDNDSCVALIVTPGEYVLQANDTKNFQRVSLKENQVSFFLVSKKEIMEIPSTIFKYKFPDKYLSKEVISSDFNILPADNYFTSKVSGAEKFGHYTGKVLASPLYLGYAIVYGIHYAGFAGMCCFFVPPICVAGCTLWGLTYFIIPKEHRMTLSRIGSSSNDDEQQEKKNPQNVNVNVTVTTN